MNSLSKLALVLTFCTGMIACSGGKAVKGDYGVVPLPQEVTLTNGNPFVLSPSTKIFYPEGNDKMKKNAEFLASYIKEITGYELATATGQPGKGISLVIDQSIQNPEGYQLTVSDNGIRIAGSTDAGVFYGIQTLRKSIPATAQGMNVELPAATINDYPRFAYRGMMLDVSRHFFPVDSVKTYLDILALHNQNTFHWHLSDDQGWRIEIKKYPELTQIGSKRKETVIGHNSGTYDGKEYGGFYTQDQIRDVINYAAERHITIIPEIDMPGHSAAFERTFKTDMQSEKGTQILKDIIDEVCATFDVPYLHIGTDEVQFTNPDFVPMMVKYIRDKGKKVISYNPGWNYKPGEIDMMQLWSYRGKAQKGIPAIDCRFHYANHFDTYADLVAMFNSRIYNQPEGSDDLAGCIVAFWNDRFIDNTSQLLAENNFYPYMLTLAERAWRGGGNCYFDGKGTLLWEDEPEQLAAFREFEHRLLWQKKTWLKEVPFPYVCQTQSEWQITDAFPNGGDLNKVFQIGRAHV